MSLNTPVPTLAEARRLLKDRKVSATQLVQACLTNIDARENDLGTFAQLTRDSALQEAAAFDNRTDAGEGKGALCGIPYTLKDVIETKGIRTAAQSRSLESHVPKEDAPVAARLKQAGGILLGKSTTWEFAHGGPSWDILSKPARNPWSLSHDPSGSSSGTAAGIAAGFALGGVGTDTGGSIRGPAAANGITGLKPTYGLVSKRGVIANSFSQDHVGPLAWSAEDVALILQEIAGYDPLDNTSAQHQIPNYSANLDQPLSGRRVGVPYSWFESEHPASDVLHTAILDALKVLQKLGAKIVKVEPPKLQSFEDAKKVIAAVELFSSHAQALRDTPELLGEAFRIRVFGGALISGEHYLNAHRQRKILAAQFQAIWNECDVLALPMSEPPGRLEKRAPEGLFWNLGYAAAFNISGNPALATRAGFTSNGLPLSIQFAGPLFDEVSVLNVAHQYEMATDWKSVRPSFLP